MSHDPIKDALAAAVKDEDKRLSMYRRLCAARDEVNARVAPLQVELDKAVAATQEARAKEMELAAQIEKLWGPDWIALKRRIGEIARSLGKIPHEA